MPDRDVVPHGRVPGWAVVCRLLVRQGLGAETLTALDRSLAAGLRQSESDVREEADVAMQAEELVSRSLLSPTRELRLAKFGFAEVDRQDSDILAEARRLAPRYFDQLQRGKLPTSRPSRRRSGEETLALSLPTIGRASPSLTPVLAGG